MKQRQYDIRPEVINYDDIRKMIPFFDGKPELVAKIMHFLRLDEVNRVHSTYCDTPGIPFTRKLVEEEFKFRLRIDNAQALAGFKDGPFITVSNHPFGSYDGILLLYLVGMYRPDFKVMVNLFLNQISAMRPNFIAVDPMKSDDPVKKKITLDGIREAMALVREGHPIGFFPAGAISIINRHGWLEDNPWKPVVIRLIAQLKVPVIPIFFHGTNSFLFNFFGKVSWQLRTLRLPSEVWRKCGTEMHISVGQPIMPDEIAAHSADLAELGEWLKARTFALRTNP